MPGANLVSPKNFKSPGRLPSPDDTITRSPTAIPFLPFFEGVTLRTLPGGEMVVDRVGDNNDLELWSSGDVSPDHAPANGSCVSRVSLENIPFLGSH